MLFRSEQHADVMDFSDLVNQIQNYLGKSDSEIRDQLADRKSVV